jgi:hypothetical protein
MLDVDCLKHQSILLLIAFAGSRNRSKLVFVSTNFDKGWYSAYQSTTSDLDFENLKAAFKNSLKLAARLFHELGAAAEMKRLLNRIG